MQQVGKSETVAVKQALRFAFHQRCRKTRENRRHPPEQRVVEFRGTIDSSVENGFDYGVQFGMGGINLNHAPLREKAAEQTSERAAQALAGTITLAQKTCGFRVAQKFTGSFYNRLDFWAEIYRADRCIGESAARRD